MWPTAWCSTGVVTIRWPRALPAHAAPLSARLLASVPPLVNTISRASAPIDRARRSWASSRASRAIAAERMHRRRVAERAAEERQHRLEHLGAHGRRGGMVEVDRHRAAIVDRGAASPRSRDAGFAAGDSLLCADTDRPCTGEGHAPQAVRAGLDRARRRPPAAGGAGRRGASDRHRHADDPREGRRSARTPSRSSRSSASRQTRAPAASSATSGSTGPRPRCSSPCRTTRPRSTRSRATRCSRRSSTARRRTRRSSRCP